MIPFKIIEVGGLNSMTSRKTYSPLSVVIRTKNEEDWIKHCLQALEKQAHPIKEVILVDSGSTDNTIKIASQFKIVKIVKIKKYLPGLSLNQGIKKASSENIAILSSHCIPKNEMWSCELVKAIEDPKIVAAYGKQIPLSYSSASDVRDLFITFGDEERVQSKDSFFHNANSIIKKSMWKKIPFDPAATNIEDRIWAKSVQLSGFKIKYNPRAIVYHHHGIHHALNKKRAESTIKIINNLKGPQERDALPDSMKPGASNVVALIPISRYLMKIDPSFFMNQIFTHLNESKYITNYYFICPKGFNYPSEIPKSSRLISKVDDNYINHSLFDLLKSAIKTLNRKNIFPDFFLYANPEYPYRPKALFDNLITTCISNGYNSTLVGYSDYSDFLIFDNELESYAQVNRTIVSRKNKQPLYKTLNGLGSIFKPSVIRENSLSDKKNQGLIVTDDIRYCTRINNEKTRKFFFNIKSKHQ